MVSRRKLEEEIARSKDPVLRKQLQELLDKRSQRWSEKGKEAKEFINRYIWKTSTPEEDKKGREVFAFWFWILVIIIIIMVIIGFFCD